MQTIPAPPAGPQAGPSLRDPPEPDTIVILIPVFNDWDAVAQLLRLIDDVVAKMDTPFQVLLVDDGSITPPGGELLEIELTAVRRLEILHLRCNLSHQRAIAIGLTVVEQQITARAVLVMDGDGEDAPSDIPKLVEQMTQENDQKVVFAARTKRSESLTFRAYYLVYSFLHKVISGISVRVGNFSIVPYRQLRRLVVVSDLWNHYAAAVFKSRVPYTMVPTVRSQRLAGKSRMNFVSLTVHGLSAMAVHGEVIGVRMLVATLMLCMLAFAAAVVILAVRLGTELAVPVWASDISLSLLLVILQLVMLAVVFTFFVLNSRAAATVIPLRDYPYFVDEIRRILPKPTTPRDAEGDAPTTASTFT